MLFISVLVVGGLVSNFILGGMSYLLLTELRRARRELVDTRALLLAELARLQPRVIEVPPTAEILPFASVTKTMLERALFDVYGVEAA
jgi:hypothetical protein